MASYVVNSVEAAVEGAAVEDVLEYVKTLKVQELKDHIRVINENLPWTQHLRVTGNKPSLASNLSEVIQAYADAPLRYNQMLLLFAPLGFYGFAQHLRRLRDAMNSGAGSGYYGRIPEQGLRSTGVDAHSYSGSSHASGASVNPSLSTQQLRFRPSPFYEIKEFVSSILQVPEAPPATGRRQIVVAFTLSEKQTSLLNDIPGRYQLRLFSTTFDHYIAAVSGVQIPAPVEFPYTSEVRINERSLGVSLKGSKKHAGRVSPPNLNRNGAVHVQAGRVNRVEISYANTPQRHVVVIALCKVTTAKELTEELKARQFRSKEEVVQRMRERAGDEDVLTGASTLKLVCPLTYMRMVIPCRSNICDHIQCFDAYSFYSMNEQSPLWLCPVCNQQIQSADLRMDGYVEGILERVPMDLETVLVEPDGAWHSLDGQYNEHSRVMNHALTIKEGTPLSDSGDETVPMTPPLDADTDLAPSSDPFCVPADVIDLTFDSDAE